jgi:diguanylate cyclase (GGDEF)-like protein
MMAVFFSIFLKAHRNSVLMMSKLTTDSLTKALSREGGRVVIERLKEMPEVVLVVMDLNDFKMINDTWGHHAGDEALVYFSRYIMQDIRQGDALIRMGGDEFVLLLQNITVQNAQVKLSALEKGLRSFPFEQQDIPLSFSFGVSEFSGDFTDSYKKADEDLYQMKKERKVSP